MLSVIHQIMVSWKSGSATWWQYLRWPALRSHGDACNLFVRPCLICNIQAAYRLSHLSLLFAPHTQILFKLKSCCANTCRLNYFPCQAKKESLNSLSKSSKTLPATPAFILVMIFNILTLTPLFDKGMTSYFMWVLQSLYVNTDTQYCDTKC